MSIIIFDCEIENCIPSKSGNGVDTHYQYCQGWADYKGMGVSVIGHQRTGHEPEFSLSVVDFKEWLSIHAFGTEIVGFNSKSFDDNLLSAFDPYFINFTEYDLLHEIRISAGLQADSRPRGRTYALGAMAEANGLGKGDGALAPELWQDGRKRAVIDYCLNDVVVTSRILELGLQGELIDPNNGEKLPKLKPLMNTDTIDNSPITL